ncbi:MAG TPA: cupin domain-containing protein [Chitinophagaceae bacterium]|jgi:mannose-6-phosphate isomerase-like protein (cupin superfamily)|nr:cupin domain-containing protein [Chitinophagaceae bacterium]
MKSHLILPAILLAIVCISAARFKEEGYVLEHERDIEQKQPGPHAGGGNTTVYPFFEGIKSSKLAFRKRVLHPGSAIGYHLQETDEIYYILSGEGEMNMNGKRIYLKAGDAVFTKAGSSHGLKPAGYQDLSLIITYNLR